MRMMEGVAYHITPTAIVNKTVEKISWAKRVDLPVDLGST